MVFPWRALPGVKKTSIASGEVQPSSLCRSLRQTTISSPAAPPEKVHAFCWLGPRRLVPECVRHQTETPLIIRTGQRDWFNVPHVDDDIDDEDGFTELRRMRYWRRC